MKKLNNFNDLLKNVSGAGQFLYNYGGFDFGKPVLFATVRTPASFKKAVNIFAISLPYEYKFFAFLVDNTNEYRRQDVKAVEVYDDGTFDNILTYRYCNYNIKKTRIDHFIRKSDADAVRKNPENDFFIVAQKKEYTRKTSRDIYERKNISFWDRVKKDDRWNYNAPRDEYDKSGYNNYKIISDRKAEAYKIRCEKQKAAAALVDKEKERFIVMAELVKLNTIEYLKRGSDDIINRYNYIGEYMESPARLLKTIKNYLENCDGFGTPERVNEYKKDIDELYKKVMEELKK